MRNKIKYIFIIINCLLTFLNEIIYHYVPGSDSYLFLKLSKQFAEFNFLDPETNCRGHQMYALFLALIGNTISYNVFFIGFVQSLIFCFSALLLIGELEKFTQKDLTGVMVILFLVPEIHIFNGTILTESLSYSLIILSFYLALKIYNNHATTLNIFLLSLTITMASLNRLESSVIIFPILYLIYPGIKNKLPGRIAILVSIPLLLFLLNGYRNYKTFNVFKVSSFNGGEAIYGGNSENLDGSHHAFWEHKEIFIPKNRIDDLNKILSEPECIACPERDSFFFRLAIEAWQNNPLQQIKVIPDKLAKNWLLPGNFDIYTSDTTKTRGLQLSKILSKKYFNNVWYAPYKHLFYMLIHWALLFMVITGLFKIDKQNRFQRAVMLLLVFYLMLSIPICGLPRWHVAIFPLLIITFTPFSIVTRINEIINRIFNIHDKT